MPLRYKSQSSPEHWSRDFVEHLRTVHFALLTVSVALIVLLSSKPYDPRVAASQMTELLQVNQTVLKDGLPLEGHVEFVPLVKSDEKIDLVKYSPWFEAVVKGNTSGKLTDRRMLFHINGPNMFICQPEGIGSNVVSGSSFSLAHYYRRLAPFNTIHDFKTGWPFLFAGTSVFDSVSALRRSGTLKTAIEKPPIGRIVISTVLGTEPRDRNAVDLNMNDTCESQPSREIGLAGSDGQYVYDFRVAVIERVTINQDVLAERFGDIRPGSFDDAVPDLVKAVRGREELDLTTLASQIYAEAAKGDEAFDAFGVKFPTEKVTRWGIIVLVGVQLYLVMYLKRLSNKLKPNDAAWDVPWMAMDQSMFARSMLFVSFVVLPIAAAVFVLFRAESELLPDGWKWSISHSVVHLSASTIGEIVLMLMGFFGSLALSLLSWKYRPKLNESAAPAQLFE